MAQKLIAVMGHRDKRGWMLTLDVDPVVESVCTE